MVPHPEFFFCGKDTVVVYGLRAKWAVKNFASPVLSLVRSNTAVNLGGNNLAGCGLAGVNLRLVALACWCGLLSYERFLIHSHCGFSRFI
jgi:hypothetical protein